MSLRRQACLLTAANGYTRGVGFLLRLLLARLMGAQAMGVMELAHSALMLAVAPVTAGIPSAVSRMAAREPPETRPAVLAAGRSLVLRLGSATAAGIAVLSPAISWLLGDGRTLPAILASAADVLLLGLCAVYSGYFCALGNMRTPALNECAEQTVRCLLSVALLLHLPGLNAALTAALPGVAEAAAGAAVLLLFRRALPAPALRAAPDPRIRREILRLAAPMTVSRLCLTGLRAFTAVLLPACLRLSGLSADQATALFGVYSGMAMPLMMLPGVVTGALCTVVTPEVSRQERHPRHLRRTMARMLLAAAAVGLTCTALLFLLSDFIGARLYRAPALPPLLRLLCPLALIFSLQQVLLGMIAGLGLQRRALTGTLAGSAATLILMALLCPLPAWRMSGAVLAVLTGHLIRLAWSAAVLHRAGLSQAPGA